MSASTVQPITRRQLHPVFAVVLAALLSCGCHRRSDDGGIGAERRRVLAEVDGLYDEYVTGDRNRAKQALFDAIEIIEKSSCFEEAARASLLWLQYARLTVLESRVGDKVLADACLLKCRYWQLRSLELSYEPTTLAFEKVKTSGIDYYIEMVEKWDRGLHDGKTADYNRQTSFENAEQMTGGDAERPRAPQP
jgi:hypothetical protein